MGKHQPERVRVDHDAVQLTVYVAEPHLHGRRSRVDELLAGAAALAASGATVLAAVEGFGRRHAHEATLWRRPDETPLTVVFVEPPERIEALLALLDRLLPDAVAVTEPVRAVQYLRPQAGGSARPVDGGRA